MLMTDTSSSQLVLPPNPQSNQTGDSVETQRQERLIKSLKAQYTADQQSKFLDLQAEAESLLQQLHAIKRQRETVGQRELVEAGAR